MARDKKTGLMDKPKGKPRPDMIGNQYWKLAHNWRKPKKYTPDELLDKANEYAKWCEANPLMEHKAFGNGTVVQLPHMRAMTIQGFCLFANMSVSTWQEYEKDEAYSSIITHVRGIFFSQKFEGAAADMLNANIIARELGLADTQNTNHSGEIKWVEEKTYDDPDK
jgi:hypothetical protein